MTKCFARVVGIIMLATAAPLGAAEGLNGDGNPFTLDADYPGGNIKIVRWEGDTVCVAPDLRDTGPNGWWFHWNFRLKGPADTPVTVVFTERNPISTVGPARSHDGGRTWAWMGRDAVVEIQVDGKPAWSFQAVAHQGASEVRYAMCPPYMESDLSAWLDRYRDTPALRVEELCRSRKGRRVELIRIGDPEKPIVLLTSRHHACEATATRALEGLLEAALGDDELGRKWRANWQMVAIPFMDKDGVEDGDQGKNRAPHDHNRDYNDEPLYPEVAALMKFGDENKDRVIATLDMHCPTLRGHWNERTYIVGSADPRVWANEQAFARILERTRQGPIPFSAGDDLLPYGKAWNTAANTKNGRMCSEWSAATFTQAKLNSTVEIAYGDSMGVEVNAESARALGRDLARALAEHLKATNR